jgi:hypothetical protein
MEWGHTFWGDEAERHTYIAIPNAFFALNKFVPEDARVTPTEYVVLMILIAYQFKARGSRLTTREIASRANVSRRQVFRALNALRKKRWLLRTGIKKKWAWYDLLPTKMKIRDFYDATELEFT